MPIVHIMCGYVGFGKTTVAKKLEQETGAIRFTPDEIMVQRFGTSVDDDFINKAQNVVQEIWLNIENAVKSGHDVIYDEGCWSANYRKYLTDKVQKMGARAVWHQVVCDLNIAKQRMLVRSTQSQQLADDEDYFEKHLSEYSPISDDEGLDVVYHKND